MSGGQPTGLSLPGWRHDLLSRGLPGYRHARGAYAIGSLARRALLEPRAECFAVELRQIAPFVDPRHRLHEGAVHRQLVQPVHEGRGQAPELPDELGVAEHPVLERHALLPRLGGAGAQHEPREVDLPSVRRRVGAVVVAALALVAEVHDFLDVARGQLLDVAVHGVHVEPVEQHLERRAERQTPPAAAADVVDPPQLTVDAAELPELRRFQVAGRHDVRSSSPTDGGRRVGRALRDPCSAG